MSRECCSTWDDNESAAETPLVRAVLDGHPVVEGHMLVYPRRHVDRLRDLTVAESIELWGVVDDLCQDGDHTIGINDGAAAGRTVPHLHVHVIPRRAGDVPDPRGGVRRLLIPEPAKDPWLEALAGES